MPGIPKALVSGYMMLGELLATILRKDGSVVSAPFVKLSLRA